ncbi:MAG TPA: AI-2E family transporter, partial [Chloroflexia bacterium]|nr:AI-2E family transporter [Chloroflexia bacterium]
MNAPPSSIPASTTEQAAQAPRENRLGLNRWLQLFLTIIAGTIVAVIAWTVIERFLHILVLLLASFLLAFLLGPLVDRLERIRLPRIVAILIVYLVIIGTVTLGVVLLIGPLTAQLQDLVETLPTLIEPKAGEPSGIDRFFQENGIPLDVAGLRSRLGEYVSEAGTSLLGGTLAIVAGLVTFVTDLFLMLAITFYLLLDGRSMHNRGLRLLPATARERWFFIEATLNRVLGGYIRGQILVAITVGVAAGVGSALLGVQYPLVIALLAFLFEFIPLIGPVLG